MKALARAALAVSLISVPALAAPAPQPPMDAFRQAFYECEGGGAFLVAYNAARPTTAVMTTSNNNRQFELKRVQPAPGIEFAGGAVKFRLDGEQVTVEGTEAPYQNCRRKAG